MYIHNIGNKLEITWSHVSDIIKILVQKELINREVNENNLRIKTITLTKKGKKLQELLNEIKTILKEEVVKNGNKSTV